MNTFVKSYERMAHPRPVLYNTYYASALHELGRSGTYRKLQGVVGDFARGGSRHLAGNKYKLVVLYQRSSRSRSHEPFNCLAHAPAGADCAEYSREDMKREFGHTLALHRRGDAPRRLNVGFWVCALWLLGQSRQGVRHSFVWYLEDDVFLPSPWHRFFGRYDRSRREVDLLVPQVPYLIKEQAMAEKRNQFNVRGWEREKPHLSGAHMEFAIARGLPIPTPTQLSIPAPTLARRLPVRNEDDYAKVPLYVWRFSERLVGELVSALGRARAHTRKSSFPPSAASS